jgi:hypothetical protein
MPTIKNVISISQDDTYPLSPEKDGSFIVEKETGTSMYYGDLSKKFLDKRTFFDKETSIINLPDSELRITCPSKSINYSKSGAIIIPMGTHAQVEILKGDCLVICSENHHAWDKKLGEEGHHEEMNKKIAKTNNHIFKGHVSICNFTGEQLKVLINSKLLKVKDKGHVKWSSSLVKSEEELTKHLSKLNFSVKDVQKFIDLWNKTVQRKSFHYEHGKVDTKLLGEELTNILIEENIIKKSKSSNEDFNWRVYQTEIDLKEILNKLKLNMEGFISSRL